VAQAAEDLTRRFPDHSLLFRFRPAASAHEELARLLGRFERRFGAPPEAHR